MQSSHRPRKMVESGYNTTTSAPKSTEQCEMREKNQKKTLVESFNLNVEDKFAENVTKPRHCSDQQQLLNCLPFLCVNWDHRNKSTIPPVDIYFAIIKTFDFYDGRFCIKCHTVIEFNVHILELWAKNRMWKSRRQKKLPSKTISCPKCVLGEKLYHVKHFWSVCPSILLIVRALFFRNFRH